MLAATLPFAALLSTGLGHYLAVEAVVATYLSDAIVPTHLGLHWLGGISHTWSLAVEEQFYLLWPLLLLLALHGPAGARGSRGGGHAGVLCPARRPRSDVPSRDPAYNTPFAAPRDILQRRRAVADACERAGRPALNFSVMTLVLVGQTERELRRRLAAVAERTSSDALRRRLSALRSRRLRRDPPDHWIVGTVPEVASRLRALHDAGVIRLMCQHPLPDDLEGVAVIGEQLAAAVR